MGGEMVLPLTLAALLEDEGLRASIHMVAQNNLVVVPGNLMPTSGLYGHCVHMVHEHECRQNIYIHKIIKYFGKNRFLKVGMFRNT